MAETVVRVAALADLHCTKTSQGAFHPLVTRIGESADLFRIISLLMIIAGMIGLRLAA